MGSEFIIENGGSNIRQFPFLSVIDGKAFVNFSQHADAGGIEHPIDGMKVSADGGATWPTYIQNQDFYFTSLIKIHNYLVLRDELFGMSYISNVKINDDESRDPRNIICYYWTSSDNGVNWTPHTGTIHLTEDQYDYSPALNGGFEFHRTIMQMPDGSLQGTIYGKYANDNRYRVLWVRSDDFGANWYPVSTVAYNSEIGSDGFCEPVVARCADNSLLCVMRIGPTYPLYQCRSRDNGVEWDISPVNLPGIDASYTCSKDPDLYLMSNGTLVLSYGESTGGENTRLLFSLDGNGESWDFCTATYQSNMTSTYTGVREIEPGKLLVIGDKGVNWLNPSVYQIWGRYITVARHVVQTGVLNFDDKPSGVLSGGYYGIDWGISGPQWYIEQEACGLKSKNIYVNSTSTSTVTKTLTLPTGKVLKSIKINPGNTAGTVVFTQGNQSKTYSFNYPGSYNHVDVFVTDWTLPSSNTLSISITASGSGAGNVLFDDLVYGDPSVSGDMTINFNDRGSTDQTLTGTYPTADDVIWDSLGPEWRTWYSSGYGFANTNLYVNSTSTNKVVKTIILPANKVLKSIKINPVNTSGIVKFIQGNQSTTYTFNNPNSTTNVDTVQTGWGTPLTNILTIEIIASGSGAGNVLFDDIVCGYP